MKLTRRDALALGLGSTAASFLPMSAMATASEEIAAFTGGADVGSGGISLSAPQIVESGISVPVSVNAPGAATIMLIATKNPDPVVATFTFGALAASQAASMRIWLAGTQDIIAIARMVDGSFVQASQTVKVTIGGG